MANIFRLIPVLATSLLLSSAALSQTTDTPPESSSAGGNPADTATPQGTPPPNSSGTLSESRVPRPGAARPGFPNLSQMHRVQTGLAAVAKAPRPLVPKPIKRH
jgi:hypothetical protein